MLDRQGQPLILRHRVRVASEKPSRWQAGTIVAISEVTGLVCVQLPAAQGSDSMWVSPERVEILRG